MKFFILNYVSANNDILEKARYFQIYSSSVIQILKIAKIRIGLGVWCSPGIENKPDSGILPVKSQQSWSLSLVVFIDVSLVMTTNIIRIRAYNKKLRMRLHSINMENKILSKF